jgi:TetR/AcrR family transcriptional regulator, mexJK operon transcriptional repressor
MGDKNAVGERKARPRRAGRLASAGVIREAATTLFLRSGYLGTSMEEVATVAGVSKQTVYTHFADKERLFTDLILGATNRADDFLQYMTTVLQDTDDLETDLRQVARRYLGTVLQPELLLLRRLVIGESGRFPELAHTYYERAPERTLNTLASSFQRLAERGLLRLDDAPLAARHFAYLVLGAPLDRAMFCGGDGEMTPAELERQADAAVRAFLAAYGGA